MEWLSNIDDIFGPLILVIYGYTIVSTIVILILENRNPVKSISWILVLILLPVVGFIFYVFLGQNLRRQKIISKKSIRKLEMINGYYDEVKARFEVSHLHLPDPLTDKRNLIELLFNNNHSLFTENNKVSILQNGKATFEALIEDLERATHHIHLEYYIFAHDTIGQKIKEILIQKARAGVKVRVIVDDVGSWELKSRFFQDMRKAGIQIFPFLQVRFPWLTSRINYRNHRKIVVIDGKVGYTGGINIADRYINGNSKYGIWRDTHLRLKGDAVHGLQSIFLIDWYFVSRIPINDRSYFPQIESEHKNRVQVVSSSPDSDWESIMQGFFHLIMNARKYVYVTTPYFMPTDSILMALKTAALSGVQVRLILPEKSDAFMTLASSHSYIREILDAGVEIFFYKKGFLHSKVLVVDDVVASIGSTNIDFRSFEQNFEVTAFIYEPEIAIQLKQDLEKDIEDCQQIFLEEWRKRSRWRKLKESIARLFSPLL